MKQRLISLAFQTDKALIEYGPLAAQTEEYGFDAVSVYNDMLYQPSWLPLLEMARHTSRILVGPSAVNPFTCHPINLAGNMALIDEATQGRSYLGLARGAWLDFLGLQPEHAVTAMREAMECVRHLLARSVEPYQGSIFRLAGGDSLRWKPPREQVPILLGSWGPQTIRACIRHVWAVKAGGTVNPAGLRFLKHTIDRAAREAGRDPAEILLATGAVTVVDTDGERARRRARREVSLYLPVIARVDPTLEIDPDLLVRIETAAFHSDFEKAGSYISDELLRLFAYAGTPQEITNQAMTMFEAGASWVEFGTPHGLTEPEGLRLLGSQVLPNLRRFVSSVRQRVEQERPFGVEQAP